MAIPTYTDFIVVAGLCLLLFLLVCVLFIINRVWNSVLKGRIDKALKMRRNDKDPFRADNGYSWDFVIVFKIYEDHEVTSREQQKGSMKNVLKQLSLGGLEVRLFYSILRKLVFCKVRVPKDRLLKEGDKINYPFPTDPVKLEALCTQGRPGQWDGIKIPHKTVETHLAPYEHIYINYNFVDPPTEWSLRLHEVYKKWPIYDCSYDWNDKEAKILKESMFRGIDRMKFMRSIMNTRGKGGCYLDLEMLLKDEAIVAYFPLHDNVELKKLEASWFKIFQFPWHLETDGIKDYFGEKIGLYFVWLGFYTSWLAVAAFAGFIIWIDVASTNSPNAPDIPYFAGFMAVWATLFLEFWKRKEKDTAMKWGMVGYEDSEQIRPAFYGEQSISPIDGKPTLHFSHISRAMRSLRSYITIGGVLLVILGTIAAIFAIRVAIAQANLEAGTIASSIIFAIEIQVMNVFYERFAVRLNDYENYRTDTEYEDALIVKAFIFQFVNGYTPLFYIAFFKPFFVSVDPCIGSCMVELETSLGTIFLTRLIYANISEVILPSIAARMRKSEVLGVLQSPHLRDQGDHEGGLTEVEQAFLMPEYDVLLSLFSDYSEMVVQFGYTTMFVTAFPLATVMSFFCNYIELRIDSWKLCQIYRRPEPKSCEDIGTWYYMLEFLSYCSVFVNSGIVAYTGTYTLEYTWAERSWIFILMSAGIIFIKLIVAFIIPDVPHEVTIQLARQELIKDKLNYNINDTFNSNSVPRAVPKYLIQSGDDDPL